MSIRTTTILFVALAFIGLITVLLVVQDVTVARMFEQVEAQDAEENVRRAQASLQGEVDYLAAVAHDWAQREDLRAFIRGQEATAPASLSTAAAYQTLDLDLIVVQGESGEIAFAGRYDPQSETLAAPDETVLEVISASVSDYDFLPTSNGLLLAAVRPVDETNGIVLIGRYLTDERLQRLTDLIQLRLQVRPLDEPSPPAGFAEARPALESGGEPVHYIEVDEVTLAAYTYLTRADGTPAAMLEIQMPRFIFRNSLTVKNFLSIALILSAVVFAVTILYVLEGLVISRVTRLNREVNQIAQTGDLSARVTVRMRDELASLSNNINQMLASLEQAQIKRAELFEQVQAGQQSLARLSRQLVEVQESERRRIALELHDEIGQMLTGLKLLLDSGANLPDEQQAERLQQSLELVNELIGRVRQISLELRPAMLDDFGLLPALIWQFDRYTAQTGVRVDFQHSGIQETRFPPPVETAAFRLVQEALTNVARHSGAGEASVRLWARDGILGVQIQDYGRGFDAESALGKGASTGLFGMRERVALLNGQFEIESAPGEGTCLSAAFPIEPNHTEEDHAHHDLAGG